MIDMPISSAQMKVIRILAPGLGPRSYFAAGVVVASLTPRVALDLDLHHSSREQVEQKRTEDVKRLRLAGLLIVDERITGASDEIVATDHQGSAVHIDWTFDPMPLAEPTVDDETLVHRASLFDTLTWKLLKTVERGETRDFYDLVELSKLPVDLHSAIRRAMLLYGGQPCCLLDALRRGSAFVEGLEGDVPAVQPKKPGQLLAEVSSLLGQMERVIS